MTTLLLRLAGPLQAWGSTSRFVQRTTENAPTKSGVLGLLAACEGRPRNADLSDLAALRFGVRIDQPGSRIKDFHKAENPNTGRVMPLSDRYYLTDAVFIAGVEGEDEFIKHLHTAVTAPRFLPYLGRRSCPPSRPLLFDGSLTDQPLETALQKAPWQASRWYARQSARTATDNPPEPQKLDLLLDCPPDQTPDFSLRDTPLTFDPRHRQYAIRGIRTGHTQAPPPHDPTAHLRPTSPTDPQSGPPQPAPRAISADATLTPPNRNAS
ncbi:type I-E CRISPR-associated protein Cas5/CasD [Streptomyces sp. NPDC000405]|uniref:type I-E CRISPR-associated protein Cas5/CasD n=1 Tax=Streptomyces sp. NPDC000405 TaxID=3161033 RepID=UPI00398CBB8E